MAELANPVAWAAGLSLLMAVGCCALLVRRRSFSWAVAEAAVAVCALVLLVPLGNGAAVARDETRPIVDAVQGWHPFAQVLFCVAVLCVPVATYVLAGGRRPAPRPMSSDKALAVGLAAATGAVLVAYPVVGAAYGGERLWFELSASVTRVLYLLTWVEVVAVAVWLVRRGSPLGRSAALVAGGLAVASTITYVCGGVVFLNPMGTVAWTDAVPRTGLVPLAVASVVAQAACMLAVLVTTRPDRGKSGVEGD